MARILKLIKMTREDSPVAFVILPRSEERRVGKEC